MIRKHTSHKELARSGGLDAHGNIYTRRKGKMQNHKGTVLSTKEKIQATPQPHHTCTTNQKLCRKSNKSTQEWMGRLQTKVSECKYRDPDRLLREQFIGSVKDDGMTGEILQQVTTLEYNEEAMSEYMLGLACRVEIKRVQRSALNNIKEAKDFDAIQQNAQKWVCWTPHSDRYKYCGTGHSPQQCPAYGKKCGECSKENYDKVVCRSL